MNDRVEDDCDTSIIDELGIQRTPHQNGQTKVATQKKQMWGKARGPADQVSMGISASSKQLNSVTVSVPSSLIPNDASSDPDHHSIEWNVSPPRSWRSE